MSPRNQRDDMDEDVVNGGRQEEEDDEAEAEEDEELRSRKKKTKKKKKKKKKRKAEDLLPINQTEEERREIRRKQRCVNTSIDQSTNMEMVSDAREKNNLIFKSVGHAREAVLDVENMKDIADKYVAQAEQLVQVPRYDAIKLVQKLRSKCCNNSNGSSSTTTGTFNWLMLGRESGICYNAVPKGCRFLAGPLEADRPAAKERKKAVRTQRQRMADVKEVRPEEIVDQKANAADENLDKASAAERAMKDIDKRLKKKCKDNTEHGTDAIQFLFNPKSFTQTVENIFNYSFLIKKGQATIGVRSKIDAAAIDCEPGLYVAPRNQGDDLEATQAVLSFNMRDWRRLCKAKNVKQCDIGHRRTKIKKGGPITSQMCD